jgi:hypothetical protein
VISFLRRLLRRPERMREHSGVFVRVDRDGIGYLVNSLPVEPARVRPRTAKRLRRGDRCAYNIGADGFARHLLVTRHAL